MEAVLFSMAACHGPKPATETATPSEQQIRAERAAKAPDSIQEKWTILNRIRQDDSLFIGRTLLNDQNQLGLVLDSTVAPDKVEGLMRKVMTQMAREFPKEDITVSVYGSSNPPRKLGTAQLNGQTGTRFTRRRRCRRFALRNARRDSLQLGRRWRGLAPSRRKAPEPIRF